MRVPAWVAVLALGALSLCQAQDTSQPQEELVKWVLPVMCSSDASNAVKSSCNDLSKVLGRGGSGQHADVNPMCCFWIEVWRPSEECQSGFLIQIEKNGARLTASDESSLNDGIAYLRKIVSSKDGDTFLPVGMISSFPIKSVKSAPVKSEPAQPAAKKDGGAKPPDPSQDK